jgi:hypothetical protein
MAALSMDIEPLDHYMVWSKRLETDPKHQWIRNQLADVANS